MKLMKLTVKVGSEECTNYKVWLNPMHVFSVAERKDGGSKVWMDDSGDFPYHVAEPPAEVARLFEEATR